MKFIQNGTPVIARPSEIVSAIFGAKGWRGYVGITYTPHYDISIPRNVFDSSFVYDTAISWRNEVILPKVHAISREQNDQIGLVPMSAYKDAKGGVKKKFFPKHGVVVAGDAKTAKGDYSKEDAASERLAETDEAKFEYTSFQKEMDLNEPTNRSRLTAFLRTNTWNSDANTVKLEQMRRVSIYGGFGAFDSGESDQYHTTLERFVLDVGSQDPEKPDQHPTEAELISAIHQMMKIHEYLYLNNITHGDMHMGNIKVIRNSDGVLLKAFDFGKAEIKKTTFFKNQRSPSRDDLRYLINKRAVSGRLETFKRNTWRKEDHEDQAKHYPLHKVCKLLSQKYLKRTNVGINYDYVERKITQYGAPFLDNLELIRSATMSDANRVLAIRGMFSVFSNQIVTGALYGDSM